MTGKGLGLLSPFIEERDLARARRNPKYAYSEGELITLVRHLQASHDKEAYCYPSYGKPPMP